VLSWNHNARIALLVFLILSLDLTPRAICARRQQLLLRFVPDVKMGRKKLKETHARNVLRDTLQTSVISCHASSAQRATTPTISRPTMVRFVCIDAKVVLVDLGEIKWQ
jgi:hypothetical protein